MLSGQLIKIIKKKPVHINIVHLMLFLLYFLPETPQDIIEPSTDSVTWGDDVVVRNSINV